MSERSRPPRAVPEARTGTEPMGPVTPEPRDGTDAAGEAHDRPDEEPVEDEEPVADGEPLEDGAVHDDDAADDPADDPADGPADDAGDGDPVEDVTGPDDGAAQAATARRARLRRRNRLAALLIGVLCLLLGFAFAVQVRSTDTGAQTAGQREEDLVRLLDNLNNQEERLRQQIADQRAALDQLTSSDSQSAAALQEARTRAQAIGILNGTVAAQGPGLRMTVRDPAGSVRVADLLDVIEELRGAGAETMQIDGVRVGVSTAVTGQAGSLSLDGHAIKAPYEILVIGKPQDMETAMNIPGGVVQRISGEGGSVDIVQEQQVVVDALRPLDQPQYASPKSGG